VIRRYFLVLLVASYVAAAVVPETGLRIRGLGAREFSFASQRISVSLPGVMLAVLLFNAGLGVAIDQTRGIWCRPSVIAARLAANLAVPLIVTIAIAIGLRYWPDPDETQNLIVGLALIAAMPIAGSSTAWSQNNDGDLALSIVLVLASTFLSPLTTPLVLRTV